jgi:ubiquinone/menaquinone biosynthesis C-methylase UbiE
MHKEPVEIYHDLTARDFDRSHDEDQYYSKIYEPLARENLRRSLPTTPCNILDAGGGSGRWSLWLAEIGHKVVLTDISSAMLEVAQEKIRATGSAIKVLRCDICEMPGLADNQFDLSMAQGDPISYCKDASRALAELVRVTRPGGCVVVSVDSRIKAIKAMAAMEWQRAKEILTTGDMFSTNPQNMPFRLHAFTVTELGELFARNNLQVTRIVGIPAFFHLLPLKAQQQIFNNADDLENYLEIERQFADEPGWAGAANHIQVVGVKNHT